METGFATVVEISLGAEKTSGKTAKNIAETIFRWQK